MTELMEQVHLKLSPLPYERRRSRTFLWTFLIYAIIAIVFCFSGGLALCLNAIPFLAILFALDCARRMQWVKYAIDVLDTDESGLRLSYYRREELLSVSIPWDQLGLSKGSTFTRSASRLITIKSGAYSIASFYADSDTGISNQKMEELYTRLKALQQAFA